MSEVTGTFIYLCGFFAIVLYGGIEIGHSDKNYRWWFLGVWLVGGAVTLTSKVLIS
jgi:hypothetical protein